MIKMIKMRNIIQKAHICVADLTMEDHGILTLWLTIISEDGTGYFYGGRVLGYGYLGAKEFEGCPRGTEEIMKIMDTVGVSQFSQLDGQEIRICLDEPYGKIVKIGNAIKNKWFDYKEFYSDTEPL